MSISHAADEMTFADAVVPDDVDSMPPVSDVEYPCTVCRREAGPYGGRGPRPKYCAEHKRGKTTTPRAPRVTGAPATLAAQATAVLVQLNGMIAIGAMALGLMETAHAMAAGNDTFEQQAYAALTTDSELCKLILKGGVKSAKISLGMAYIGLGMGVAPVAVAEVRTKRAETAARKAAESDDANRP